MWTQPNNNFNIIAAATPEGIIGVGDNCPHAGFAISEDRAIFRKLTMNGTVIMGNSTYKILSKPLPDRRNIVLTRDCVISKMRPDVIYVNDFEDALKKAVEPIWVIGGAQIYKIALQHPKLQKIYINRVECAIFNDEPLTYFPDLHKLKNPAIIKNKYTTMSIYSNNTSANVDEDNYIELLRRLISAPLETNRTGIDTRCLFAESLRFKLYNNNNERILPLLTTKKLKYSLVVSELLWFIGGKCNEISYLHEYNNHIWDLNTTREFLDSRGLKNYDEGCCGPIYGCQWRDFGGVDQLQNCINQLKTNPRSRRIIVSAWNPPELDKMALPPCHWSYQFCVQGGRLNIIANMRSADVALGVPFNIASYATLLHIVSAIVKIPPGELVLMMADCHLYSNHIDGALRQIKRTSSAFPTLIFPDISSVDDAVNLQPDDFMLTGYSPKSYIKYPMAV